jgi:hypothetical protein
VIDSQLFAEKIAHNGEDGDFLIEKERTPGLGE